MSRNPPPSSPRGGPAGREFRRADEGDPRQPAGERQHPVQRFSRQPGGDEIHRDPQGPLGTRPRTAIRRRSSSRTASRSTRWSTSRTRRFRSGTSGSTGRKSRCASSGTPTTCLQRLADRIPGRWTRASSWCRVDAQRGVRARYVKVPLGRRPVQVHRRPPGQRTAERATARSGSSFDADHRGYVRVDNRLLQNASSAISRRRGGDLVFSRTGELLGIMVNSDYCAPAAGLHAHGDDSGRRGEGGSEYERDARPSLSARVQQMPIELQQGRGLRRRVPGGHLPRCGRMSSG